MIDTTLVSVMPLKFCVQEFIGIQPNSTTNVSETPVSSDTQINN